MALSLFILPIPSDLPPLHCLALSFLPSFLPSFFLCPSFVLCSYSNTINQDRFPTLRIAQASFRFLIFSSSREKVPSRKHRLACERRNERALPVSSLHLQFSFSFRDAVTLSQIEIFPVWKMFSFARKSLDLFANEEELKRRLEISLLFRPRPRSRGKEARFFS